MAAGAVQAAGAKRIPRLDPQRELIPGAHHLTALIENPPAPDRREHLKRRLGEHGLVAVSVAVADRLEQRLVAASGLEVERSEHERGELCQLRMPGMLGFTALLVDRLGQRVRVLDTGTQPLLADLPQRPRERILAATERVEQDP